MGRKLRAREKRRYTEEFVDEELEGCRKFSVEDKLLSDRFDTGKTFVREMRGEEFNLRYIQEHGFDSPIIVKNKTGLGLKVPDTSFSVSDVKHCVGNRRVLDVMDVSTQKDVEMTMKEWCQYYENPVREKLLNVISLEFSHTKLETLVESPKVVRQVDWVDWIWPRHLKLQQTESSNSIADMKYPKVQKYCLMSVKGCYTDFHIDFGGTSVWYHILKGHKVFWLIPPSERNIQLYEQWVLSGKQADIFFGDTVDNCARVHLYDGFTFFIPTGWVHAVYTSEDSLVFGGNFLHSFAIEKQLRIAQVEDITKVPAKFRYPFYHEMLWYVLQRYVYCLTGKSHLKVKNDGTSIDEDHRSKDGLINNHPSTSGHLSKFSEINNNIAPKNRIHLTSLELSGLKSIVMWLGRLAGNKKSVPDLIRDPTALLNDAKLLIDEHNNDDHNLAITGKPILFWKREKSTSSNPHQSIVNNSSSTSLNTTQPSTSSSSSSSGLSVTAQLRQIKKTSFISSLSFSSTNSSNDDQNRRSESPPTRPLSSNQYSVSITPLSKPFDQIPHSFAKLIATTGVGAQNRVSMGFTPIPSYESSSSPNAAKCISTSTTEALPLPISKSISVDSSSSSTKLGKTETSVTASADPIAKDGRNFMQLLNVKNSAANDSARRRRTRCKKCAACLRADCGDCHFCKDMKKFGGPGRMKQSCITRQCLAPVLPHTACCIICNRDGWEKMTPTIGDTEAQSSLLECSKCWEIVHPVCLMEKNPEIDFDGVMSDELPNSWECPKCVASMKNMSLNPNFKLNNSLINNSMTSNNNAVTITPVKSATSAAPAVLNNHNDNNSYNNSPSKGTSSTKRDVYDFHTDDALPEAINKKARLDGRKEGKNKGARNAKIKEEIEDEDNEDGVECSNDTASVSKSVKSINNRSEASNSSQPSSSSKSSDSHVRSCARFPLLQEAIKKQKQEQVDKKGSPNSNKVSKSPALSNDSSKSTRTKKSVVTSRERLFKSLKGLKKSSEMGRVNGFGSVTGKKSLTKQNNSTSSPVPSIQTSNTSESPLSFSSTNANLSTNKKATGKVKTEKEEPMDQKSEPTMTNGTAFDESMFDEETDEDTDNIFDDHPEENNDFEEEVDKKKSQKQNESPEVNQNIARPKYVVRPAPLPEDLSSTEEDETEDDDESEEESEREKAKKKFLRKFNQKIDNDLVLMRDVILPVFRFLSKSDLLNCMRVCRKWNTWSVDPILWKNLDLTRKRITYYALLGIVRRQPLHLNLGWTNISKKQLSWLIPRLPQLQSLTLTGCPAATLTALCSCNCPFLKKLDLSWVDSVTDTLVKDLLAPPPDLRPGLLETKTRLKQLTEVSLAGADITDVSIRLLSNNLPLLTKVDLSNCPKITDMGIGSLAAAKASKLMWLSLSSCPNISNASFDALKKCPHLTHLDMRHCTQVSEKACERFTNTTGLVMEGKEKIFKRRPPKPPTKHRRR